MRLSAITTNLVWGSQCAREWLEPSIIVTLFYPSVAWDTFGDEWRDAADEMLDTDDGESIYWSNGIDPLTGDDL